MALIPLTNGYTGMIKIGGCSALLTSFNFVMNTNLIKSEAAVNVIDGEYNSSSSQGVSYFTHLLLDPVIDIPTYELSVSLELTQSVYLYLLGQLKSYFRNKVSVEFTDSSNGMTFNLTDCYVTNFSLSVESGSAATASLNFVYFKETLEFSSLSSFSLQSNGGYYSDLKGNVLMPYYRWGVMFDNTNYPTQSFSLNFSQTITPKFGCTGSNSSSAILPIAYVRSIPSVTYELNFLLAKGITIPGSSQYNLIINYLQKNGYKIILINCRTESYTPLLANSSSANAISITGNVFGYIGGEEE